jgi:hypothetical protein
VPGTHLPALNGAAVASRFWPFRRPPAGRLQIAPRFVATTRRPDVPAPWLCLWVRPAPRRAPARAAPCAAPFAAPSFVSWLPATVSHWRAPSSRCQTCRRSRAAAASGRSPRCATRPEILRFAQQCVPRPVAPAAVCCEMTSSSTSWRPHHVLPRRGLHRAAASYHNAASRAIDLVTRISRGDDHKDGAAWSRLINPAVPRQVARPILPVRLWPPGNARAPTDRDRAPRAWARRQAF